MPEVMVMDAQSVVVVGVAPDASTRITVAWAPVANVLPLSTLPACEGVRASRQTECRRGAADALRGGRQQQHRMLHPLTSAATTSAAAPHPACSEVMKAAPP